MLPRAEGIGYLFLMRTLSMMLTVLFSIGALYSDEKEKPKQVSGKADVLRHVKKSFAEFVGTDEMKTIRLRIEGEDHLSEWLPQEDAEFKIDGWWGRPEQFRTGDRVWVWFAVDRIKEPVSILLMADEVSEMDIHGQRYSVTEVDGETATIEIPGEKKVRPREVTMDEVPLKVGDEGLIQTADGNVRRFLTGEEFEEARARQQEWMRNRWRSQGLPGMIGFVHPLSGEMEVYLDHEGKRWARYQSKGAEVELVAGREISAQVKIVEPWREKTRIRLVTKSGMDQLGLKPGSRIALKVPEPPEEIQESPFPTDLDHLRTNRDDRIEWFLATVYCPCGIAGDRCTGMYYTLSACNVNTCGGPDDMREILSARMEKGLTDRKIFEQLIKERGRDVWWPHLLR